MLAALPFPIYLTTNPDHLLVEALREAGKQPEVGLCPWNESVDWSESDLRPRDSDFRPSVHRPLVYYLFGRLDDPPSLVLTEDDYFDYLIGLTRNNELVPGVVPPRPGGLLLALPRLPPRRLGLPRPVPQPDGPGRPASGNADYAHVAVQIDPEEGRNLDPEGAASIPPALLRASPISASTGATFTTSCASSSGPLDPQISTPPAEADA